MKHWLKTKVVLRSMNKRKKESPFDIEKADNYVLPIDADANVNNSHYFSVHSFDTKECLFYRSAKRGSDGIDEVWLVYRNKLGEVFIVEKDHFPKTELNPTTINCIKAGKTLEFLFDGYVKKAIKTEKGYFVDEKSERIPLKITGIFTGKSEIFEFTEHMDSKLTAKAIAREKLTKEFREAFNQIHQIHYEQGGTSTITGVIGTDEVKITDYPTVRDHSFGKRDWNFFDRYIWMIIILENGDFMHTSLMRYPVLTELQAGFYMNGKMKGLTTTTPMDKLPVIGTTPNEFSFDVTYNDKTKKHVDVKLDFVCPFYFENEFNVNEGVCEFTVDGMRGRGIAEFSFNKDKTRWSRTKK